MYLMGKHGQCAKLTTFRSDLLRGFARGQNCTMLSQWCNCDPSTVVLCHSSRLSGAGMAQKTHDFWGYHGCSECHRREADIEFKGLYTAIMRTQFRVFQEFGTITP